MTLLHDAPEYVIGDIISPVKAAVGESYKSVEIRLLAAIHIRFGLPPETPAPLHRKIKRADQIAAFLEATTLAGFVRQEALKLFGRPEPLPREVLAMLEPVSAAEAEAHLKARLAALLG
jgi:5'-deoxynucleotidase YfbR-like HD superfamily hydrolase